MPLISDSMIPNGIGILTLQHQGYIAAGYSLDYRGSIRAVRVLRQDEMGAWEYDQESPGDVVGGNLWLSDTNQRRIPAWSWVWPTSISASGGGSGGTPTVGAGAPPSSSKVSNAVFPLGGGAAPDNRFQPKSPKMPFRDGKASGDPVAAARNAANAAAQAQAQGNQNVMRLGIGAQVVPFSGGSFPSFSGVRTDFSGFGFARFEGVRTNFSGGGFAQFSGVRNFLRPQQRPR